VPSRCFANYHDYPRPDSIQLAAMWRRLRVLSPMQSLLLASVSAASIAFPLAMHLVSRDKAALVRILVWPDTLTLYITFSLVFLGVIPALLGYYHLGRLRLLLNVAAGFALAWSMAVCAILSFVWVGHYFQSVSLSTVVYAACVVLVYMLIARLHLGAARSKSVRDAQQKLRLFSSAPL